MQQSGILTHQHMNNNHSQKQHRHLPFTLFSTEMMLFGWFRGIESVCPNVDDVVHDTNHVLLLGCNGGCYAINNVHFTLTIT